MGAAAKVTWAEPERGFIETSCVASHTPVPVPTGSGAAEAYGVQLASIIVASKLEFWIWFWARAVRAPAEASRTLATKRLLPCLISSSAERGDSMSGEARHRQSRELGRGAASACGPATAYHVPVDGRYAR